MNSMGLDMNLFDAAQDYEKSLHELAAELHPPKGPPKSPSISAPEDGDLDEIKEILDRLDLRQIVELTKYLDSKAERSSDDN